MKTIEVAPKEVSRLIGATRMRRSVKIDAGTRVHVNGMWDSGSRNVTTFRNIRTGQSVQPTEMKGYVFQTQGNPFGGQLFDVTLDNDHIAVTHVTYCGKDLGFRIRCSPARFAAIERNGIQELLFPSELPEEPETTEDVA